MNDCLSVYNSRLNAYNKDKLWHYVYIQEEIFRRTLISDIKNNPNTETFDKMFNEHSQQIQKDILRLKDLNYYSRTGLKRKKGYLFYGEPGCGKTSTVMAMANFDKRHIIEVPLSRVKSNQELEDILNLNYPMFEDFNKDEVIILFDEIDCNNDALSKRENTKTEDKDKKEFDKELVNSIGELKTLIKEENSTNLAKITFQTLDIGTILSRLDGIGNYNGLIIVATTNHKDKLDPAIYRELRLTPIQFDYSRKEDMINMIEHFYDIKLKDNEKLKIPDRNAKISPAKFRVWLEKYEDNYKDLLKYLSTV